jgi:signal peptidase II
MQKTKIKKKCGNAAFVVLIVVLLDQITKQLVRANILLDHAIPVIKNFLSISYIANTGAGFSILQNFNTALIFFLLFVLGLLLFFWDTLRTDIEKFWVAFVVGGIIGNLIDRMFFGRVTDFISFSFWPTFNVADSAVCIGIIALIVVYWKNE